MRTTSNINSYYNDIQRRKLQRFRIREDHAKEFNVKLVKLTSFLLYLLHSLHKFDIYFHRKEFRRISRPNSLLNTCFFSFWVFIFSNKRFALYPENLNSCLTINWIDRINHLSWGIIISILRLNFRTNSLCIKLLPIMNQLFMNFKLKFYMMLICTFHFKVMK